MKPPGNRFRKLSGFFMLLLFPFLLSADKVTFSQVIDWDRIIYQKSHTGWTKNLFKGSTRVLDQLDIKAFMLHPGKVTHTTLIDRQTDEIYLVKEGSAEVILNNIPHRLEPGAVAVACQGTRITIANKGSSELVYYSIKIRPKSVKSQGKTSKKEKIFTASPDTINVETTSEGNVRNIHDRPVSSLQNLIISSVTLKEDFNRMEGETRKEEEVVIVSKGLIFGTVRDQPFRVGPGSLVFLTNEDPFQIANGVDGETEYYVIRWLAWMPDKKK